MNNIVFFDSEEHHTLLPLTYTRPVSALRVGILTIAEKWAKLLGLTYSNHTQPYLETEFPIVLSDDNVFILGGLLPSKELETAIQALQNNEALVHNGRILAAKGNSLQAIKAATKTTDFSQKVQIVQRPWDIFTFNGNEIQNDIELIGVTNQVKTNNGTQIIGDASKLYIDPTAKVYATALNTNDGPIYIGEHAEIMEGSVVRGPFALCDHSTLKMGAKIYGGTTIGPHSKVGGEIGNSVIQGYSNKGHDGYLGNSVLGAWCNLGADTNTSNLKNNYSNVKAWDYSTKMAEDTGLTFCGLIMGDHGKTGINTMLNTGTLVGVGANIFGANFPPKFIPSFSWGSGSEFTEHDFQKFCTTAERVMSRRGKELTASQKEMFRFIFTSTSKYRK